MIKDIAWPKRRLVYITKDLPWWTELWVLSLGLAPLVTGDSETTQSRSRQTGRFAIRAWKAKKPSIRYYIAICSVAVVLCLASLLVMEIYSKGSALGCPAPIFVVVWHVVALIPGSIHSSFANLRRRRFEKESPPPADQVRTLSRSNHPTNRTHNDAILEESPKDENVEPTREKNITSAIHGANETWLVQIAWGICYITGTLCFSSIMAVTVPELVVWAVLLLTTAARSKILAFLLCLLYEDTG
ncbi:hypothetical protein T440DRAFT_481255 [Plenodomus tracheiphilus IPT5]|uniref:Transmembrane protein n=1 Tax=Plenodomus tracheiphilus IPT5 TaxID=1408161 RepID=A0A6A7AXB7_9PLEO|nr:hypothetical protein T440DRAFT_481255 [Plenodomus tracheiphilus IPT5]